MKRGVTNTADPAGGSEHIEALTDSIERGVSDYLKRIDEMGGTLRAIETGYIQNEIQNAAYEYQREIESGERMVVGVNRFRQEERAVPAFRLDPALERAQVETLRQVRASRSRPEWRRSLRPWSRPPAKEEPDAADPRCRGSLRHGGRDLRPPAGGFRRVSRSLTGGAGRSVHRPARAGRHTGPAGTWTGVSGSILIMTACRTSFSRRSTVRRSRLFRNLGKRGFADATRSSGLTRLTLPMAGYSPTIADFDNDGWKDIFVTRGHVQALGSGSKVQIDQPNTVFRNLGGAKFQALTEEAGLSAQPPARHRGSAVGDLNGDGRLDVVTTALSAPAELWVNDSPGDAHWLELKLEGTASNRDGIGARIKLTAGGRVQYNHVSFAAGYASSSAAPIHFGLGPAASASLIEIRWPSGIVQELKDVAADRVIRVKEPSRN